MRQDLDLAGVAGGSAPGPDLIRGLPRRIWKEKKQQRLHVTERMRA